MWGIHTIRVVCLGLAILVILGGNGCCSCCKKPAEQNERMKKLLYQSDTSGPPSEAPAPQKDKPAHLTPERIHGGII